MCSSGAKCLDISLSPLSSLSLHLSLFLALSAACNGYVDRSLGGQSGKVGEEEGAEEIRKKEMKKHKGRQDGTLPKNAGISTIKKYFYTLFLLFSQ